MPMWPGEIDVFRLELFRLVPREAAEAARAAGRQRSRRRPEPWKLPVGPATCAGTRRTSGPSRFVDRSAVPAAGDVDFVPHRDGLAAGRSRLLEMAVKAAPGLTPDRFARSLPL